MEKIGFKTGTLLEEILESQTDLLAQASFRWFLSLHSVGQVFYLTRYLGFRSYGCNRFSQGYCLSDVFMVVELADYRYFHEAFCFCDIYLGRFSSETVKYKP